MVNNKQEKQMLEAIKNAKRVMTKARKHYEPKESEYLAVIEKNKSIQIFVERSNQVTIARKFEIGDIAEYDSFNLSYTGVIESITDKTVTIIAYKGSSNEKKHRLDVYTFCWRNHKFDLEETRARNAETSMYI
jgi:hypothetical protein